MKKKKPNKQQANFKICKCVEIMCQERTGKFRTVLILFYTSATNDTILSRGALFALEPSSSRLAYFLVSNLHLRGENKVKNPFESLLTYVSTPKVNISNISSLSLSLSRLGEKIAPSNEIVVIQR